MDVKRDHWIHMLALPVGMILSDGPRYEKRLKPRFFMHDPHLIFFPKAMACLFKLLSSNPFALLCIKKIGLLIHPSKFSHPFE